METTYFEETQYFRWGFILIPALITIMFGAFFLVQVIFKIKVGSRPIPSWLHLIICLLVGVFTLFMGLQKLQIKITSDAIYFSLGAFAPLRSIKTDAIASIHLRKYNGTQEFSGWGSKGNDKENCYTTSGDEGIEIRLKDSTQKSILIGTHKPAQVNGILSKYFSGISK